MKLPFYGFLTFFGTFTHKVAQTWFVLHETCQTILLSIYYFVELFRIENHSHMLEITFYVAIFWLLSFFGTFAHKVAQTWFVSNETLYIIVLK